MHYLVQGNEPSSVRVETAVLLFSLCLKLHGTLIRTIATPWRYSGAALFPNLIELHCNVFPLNLLKC